MWGHVKRGKWVPSHQHLNVSYLLVADERDALQIREGENSRVGWLPAERLLEYTNEWQMDGVYAKLLARARGAAAERISGLRGRALLKILGQCDTVMIANSVLKPAHFCLLQAKTITTDSSGAGAQFKKGGTT